MSFHCTSHTQTGFIPLAAACRQKCKAITWRTVGGELFVIAFPSVLTGVESTNQLQIWEVWTSVIYGYPQHPSLNVSSEKHNNTLQIAKTMRCCNMTFSSKLITLNYICMQLLWNSSTVHVHWQRSVDDCLFDKLKPPKIYFYLRKLPPMNVIICNSLSCTV